MDLYALFSECLNIRYNKVGLSANYAVRADGDVLYIFFEDSDGKNDWLRNLDFPAKPYKAMDDTAWFAHRGFLKTWKEIEPYLEARIKSKRVKKIISTGYSHGAAIAVLCHEYVWYNRQDIRENIEGFGFGCPRVVWGSKGAEKRWERFCVIRNINDIVTHLPPAIFGFSHVGTLLKIGERGKYSTIEAHYAENILTELSLMNKNQKSAP